MATTTTTSGGTVTSLSNTPQAQDDIFTTGVIGASTAAITEDLLGVMYLDVMSNDLGGNAKTLWSLDNATSLSTATKIYAPADLLIQDTGRAEATSTDTSFNGAKIWITSDGKVGYDAATLSTAFKAQLQSLAAGGSLTDSFTYAIRLGNGTLSWATAQVQFAGLNDAVTIGIGVQSGTVTEEAATTLSLTDSLNATGTIAFNDVDLSDTHTASFVAAGGNTTALGNFVLAPVSEAANAANGTVNWTYILNNAAAQHLAQGQTATETYVVTLNDGHGSTTTQNVTITITGTNDQVQITSGVQVGDVKEDSGDYAANGSITFTDVDRIDTHSISVTPGASGYLGSFTTDPLSDSTGTGSGSLGWHFAVNNAALQFLGEGQTRTQTYNVAIGDGAVQTVTITITGTNDQPTLTIVDSTGAMNEGNGTATLSDSGALSFADLDSTDTVTVSQTANNDIIWSAGVLNAGVASALVAGFSVDQNSWDYSSHQNLDFLGAGETVTFSYAVVATDDSGAVNAASATQTVTITITGTNDAPVLSFATGNDAGAVQEDTTLSVSGQFSSADIDHAATSTWTINGSASGTYGSIAVDSTGKWTYTLANGTDGVASAVQSLGAGESHYEVFSVQVSDGLGGVDTQLVTVTVSGTNDAAVLSSASVTLTETDAPLTTNGTLTISDVDSAATFVAQSNTAGSYGQFSLGTDGAWSYVADSAHNEFVAGTTYTDTFAVSSSDGTLTSVTVHITGSNDAAVLSSASVTLTETNAPLTTSGTLTISDVDSAATFVAQPGTAGNYGQFSIGTNGAWSYVADSAHNEFVAGTTYTDTFTVSSTDGTATAVTMTITGSNDDPVVAAADVTGGATELVTPVGNLTDSGTISFSDVDLSDSHSIDPTITASAGALGSLTASVTTQTSDMDGTAGVITWNYSVTASAVEYLGATDTKVESFTITLDDGHGGTVERTIEVTITGTNDGPVAVADAAAGTENQTLTIDVLANDTDVDDGRLFTLNTASAPVDKGSASVTGNQLVFNPGTDFDHLAQGAVEHVTLSYMMQDEHGVTSSSSVDVTITGTNDGPVAVADAAAGTENQTLTIDVLANDTDVDDGHVFTLNTVSAPTGLGTASVVGNQLLFNPGSDFNHLAQGVVEHVALSYTMQDEHGALSSSTVDVTITGTNDEAVITGDVSGGVVEDGTLSDSGTLVVSDEDSGESEVQPVAAGTTGDNGYGTFEVLVNGAWTYTLNNTHAQVQALPAGVTLQDSITVTSQDGTDSQLISITITGTNDAPVMTASGSLSYTENQAATAINSALTITDVDSSNLTGATVSITSNFATGQDVLAFTNQNGITGSYNAGTGVLTLSGAATVAQYQTALRSVTYSNSSDNPSTTARTISFQVDDGAAANHASNVATTTVTVAAVNDAPTTSGLAITETSISFVAADPDNATLSLQSPFAVAFGNPSITSGAGTNLSPVEQGSVVSGTLQVKDGSVAAGVVELYLGTSAGNNNFQAISSDTAIYGFGGADSLSGASGADWIFGGADNDVIVGAANDRLLDGGTGTDTLNVGSVFVNTSDSQIANIENIQLTAASGVLILNAQTESFTIFGTSGADQIVAGSGNDTIFGTDNDTLLDGGTGTDTLGTGPNFTSTSDGQITGIENVLIGTAATLNLSNQTEGFTITGSSGADTITGSAGTDSISTAGGNDIINGAQNDTLLDGGANTDTLNVSANFTSTSNTQIANIENVTLTTSGLTLNLGNQTEAFNINGSSGIDSISGGSGADTINGQAGNDTLTGNGGADQFRLRTNGGTDTIADYTDNTDKIGFLDGAGTGGVNFTTVGSSAGTTLLAGDFQARNSINNINNNDDNKVDLIDASSQTTSQITTGTGGSATNTYVIVFNSTTGKGEIWFDTDWSNTASRVQVATLNNVTTLAGVANITASDIVVHDSTLGPAGIAGSPINLGLADAVTRADVSTVTISGLPAGWTLNQGTDNGNGTWTVDKGSLDMLTVTTPADFVGARVLPVTMTWTNADGTVDSEVIRDNVEAYAPGSPIFALSADDNLTGSSGADTFVFAQPIGNNVIHSFDVTADKIDLIGFTGITGFADLSIVNDANGNALVSIGSGQSVTLKGVDATDLSEAHFQFDVDPVTTNTGTLTIADGAIMPFGGSIHNSGTIELGSTGSETNLEILFRGATLTGGGQVQLSDSAQNVIFGGSADTVLTNVDNRISGAGQLGAGQMVLVNAGLILASGVNSLVLDTGTHTITNSGVLESTGAGGMTVASAVDNSGHLWANGGDMRLLADVMGNGSATIDGDATLTFSGTAHGSVAFHGEGAGTLVIAQAEAAGSLVGILGLESDDMLTFGDLAFGANTQLSYSANASGAGGLLTVDDGMHRAEVNLLGHYTVDDFQVTDGGETGTQVSYNGASSGTLVGSMAADVLSGGDGNDILAGRGGEDTLSGGAGADMFAYLNEAEGGDTILDYNFAEGDALDLSALLSANFVSGTSQASDFVQLAQSGSDITVKVDTDGAANGANFADVAVLANTGTSGADLVRTWFGEADHTLTA